MASPEKTRQYAEQSARAAADIATWPEWMQRNLEVPVEHYDPATRLPAACCASGRCTRRNAAGGQKR